ncbi:PspC domain-containing protein [Actinomyces sp. zg-332]|uniref:ATP-binding protein n=1 Tax=Actinomyces sp. zg-332 TaxID=2708340 RepID=UPI00142458C4|nr:ATP-binding protein [Actinomyces sp. zg-332]QPK93848.1 PspC domain-containing protein [Actinomyces sp. zg-332]
MNSENKKIKRPPLRIYSRHEGALLLGVCKGLSVHLQIDILFVRFFMVITAFTGAGIFLYIWLLIFIPKKSKGNDSFVPRQENSIVEPLTQRNNTNSFNSKSAEEFTYGFILLLCALNYVFGIDGYGIINNLLVLFIGLLLISFESLQAYRQDNFSYRIFFAPRIIVGFAVSFIAIVYFIASQFLNYNRNFSINQILEIVLFLVLIIVVLIVLLVPIVVLLFKSLTKTQYENFKERERANITAHLHDGVLQTLALIQQNSTNAEEVSYLARTQERDLRAWLYGHRPEEGTSTSSIIKEQISAIEDNYRKNVELVVVGDTNPNDKAHSFISALRETTINALQHGQMPVSIYVEISSQKLEFYVRDRGKGFIVEDIPPTRLGVRNSILKRVIDNGGKVTIKNSNGCEVSVEIPLKRE